MKTNELQVILFELTDNYNIDLIVEQLALACQRRAQNSYDNDDNALGNAWATDGETIELIIPKLCSNLSREDEQEEN
jgi:hypothetical protein